MPAPIINGEIGSAVRTKINTAFTELATAQGAIAAAESDVSALQTAVTTLDTEKQDALVSGTNIKTVNGESLVGPGNVVIAGGGATSLDGLSDVVITTPATGQVVKYNGTTWVNAAEDGVGSGTVTSVGMSVPTGLVVTNSPVTTTGTLAVALDTGYVIPTQTTLDGKVDATDFSPIPDLVGAVELTDEFIGLRAGVPYKEPLSSLPTGSMTAAQIRDALETLTTTNRLDASAIQNLPTVSAGSPVTVTHNGGGANPDVGDTVTATFSAGYSGTVQWTRNGSNIGGATSPTYVLVTADGGTTIAAVVTSLIFTATGLAVSAAATAPAAFTAGQWTAAATATPGQISFDLTALPSDGGSAITALEYRVNTGSAIAFTGTGTGVRVVTAGLTAGVAVDLQVRAVNAVGAGAWSDVKNRTPLAAGATLAWGAAGDFYQQGSALTAHPVPVPAGMSVGDMLIVAIFPFGTISSVVTSTGQSLTLLADYASAGEVGRFYGVVLTGSVPTTVTVNLTAGNDLNAQAFAAEGVTQVAGTVLDGSNIDPRTDFTYNTDAADALVISLYTAGGGARVLTGFTPVGGSGTVYAKFAFDSRGVATGTHSGATGLNNAAVTWSEADTGGGRWLSLALKA